MNLKAVVEKYLAVTGGFGRPMPLAAFGLDRNQTEAMMAAWEEDYQLHRHLELVPADTAGDESPEKDARYVAGGIAYTHVVMRAAILTVIG